MDAREWANPLEREGRRVVDIYLDLNKKQQLADLGYLNPMRFHDQHACQRALQQFVNDIPKLAVLSGHVPKDVAISKGMFSEDEYGEWLSRRKAKANGRRNAS